jgi:chemotaxis protein methyltransferase CheR
LLTAEEKRILTNRCAAGDGMVTGMIQLSDSDFTRLTGYLRERFGINLIKKRTLIESRLNNYLVSSGYDNYKAYLDHALSDKTGAEVSQMINFLTTNYSYFMREWDHFQFFKDQVLPEMARGIRDNDLRTWSAGCSTGQEPFTLAMLIGDYTSEHGLKWDTKVLATDISMKALEAARKGMYEDDALKSVPAYWRLNYFTRQPDGKWEVSEALKREVIFRRLNLIEGEFPFKKPLHIIFCRNVMIYFNEETKTKLVDKFYKSMVPGGYLFIGQSESIDRTDGKFKLVMPSVYKKVVL